MATLRIFRLSCSNRDGIHTAALYMKLYMKIPTMAIMAFTPVTRAGTLCPNPIVMKIPSMAIVMKSTFWTKTTLEAIELYSWISTWYIRNFSSSFSQTLFEDELQEPEFLIEANTIWFVNVISSYLRRLALPFFQSSTDFCSSPEVRKAKWWLRQNQFAISQVSVATIGNNIVVVFHSEGRSEYRYCGESCWTK